MVTTAEPYAVEVTEQVSAPLTATAPLNSAAPLAVRPWYAAADRVRARWLRLGTRAELATGAVLLVLAAVVFTLNAVL
ncbi:hypothetical protein [Kribbella sp. CA-247076]|uniref:hypothetical protein n=1 Tax=Kribbella sp. CA-247076 TaxID=3239941 RepID=UPI003D8E80C2